MRPKLILALLLAMCMWLQALAQNCAVSDKVDPFTHQRLIETDEAKLYASSILSSSPLSSAYFISFAIRNGELFICMDAETDYVLNPGMSEFKSVTFLFSDNSTITLNDFESPGGYKPALSDKGINKSYSRTTKLIINKFIDLKLTMVRFDANSAPIDVKIKPGRSNDISKLANCILSYPATEIEWVNGYYKIDKNLSIKLPTRPIKTGTAVKASDENGLVYIVNVLDLLKTEGNDSTALVSKATKPEYLSAMKNKLEKSMPGFNWGDVKPGLWKKYTCYHVDGTYSAAKANTYFYMVLIGSTLYDFYVFVPNGMSSKAKDDFFNSLVLN